MQYDIVLLMYGVQKFAAQFRILGKSSAVVQCCGGGFLFFDAAHLHAQVMCVAMHDDAAGIQRLGHLGTYLRC